MPSTPPNGDPATSNERTPLLGNLFGHRRRSSSGSSSSKSSTTRARRQDSQPIKTRKPAPTALQSVRNLIFPKNGWINILLVCVPLSFISYYAGWGSTADFVISFLAIVPLASLLGDATEQVSLRLGQTLGGLLNATFGNAVEAIVGILALTKGQIRIVQTSMLGSILSNILLVLGCSFLAAGIAFKEANFQVTAAQASASLMTLACITLVVPAAYHAAKLESRILYDPPLEGGTNISEILGRQAQRIAIKGADGIVRTLQGTAEDEVPGSDDAKSLRGLLTISRGTAIILLIVYILYLFFQLKTHAYLFEAAEGEGEEEDVRMEPKTAVAALVVVTVVTAFCADFLVDSIDEFAQERGIPKAFIGLILLPIVGNAAEHLTSVWMAAKGKMEITIGVAVGSSIQIAVGVIPIMVIIGWIIGQDMTLYFENFETICLTISVLLVSLLIQDGKSNYMEGVMLVSLYLIIAVAFWVS